MLDLIYVVYDFGLAVLHANKIFKDRCVYVEIHVFVDSDGQYKPTMFLVEGWKISTATAQGDSKRGLRDNHSFLDTFQTVVGGIPAKREAVRRLGDAGCYGAKDLLMRDCGGGHLFEDRNGLAGPIADRYFC